MKIVPIRKSDKKECAEIILKEFNKQGEEFTKKTALKRVNTGYQKGFSFCVKEKRKILGLILAKTFYYAKGKYIWVEELVVREEHQGKGIGKKLMKKLETACRKKKVDSMTLNTKEINTKFYKKLGYKKTKFIMMEKDLRKTNKKN